VIFFLTQLQFVLTSALTFCGLFLACYNLYGHDFVHEAFLYHVTRRDARHNFSVYFYLLYITPKIQNLLSVLLFSPQLLILGYTSVAFCNPDTLYLGLFIQTAVFVTFNKVSDLLPGNQGLIDFSQLHHLLLN
jgi:phosphatidylinositol glycan class M